MSGPRLLFILMLSGALTAMQLSTSLFLLYLYDRVLPSGSLRALGLFVGLVMGLLALFALLDFLRGRVLWRAGVAFVQDLERRARNAIGPDASGDRDRDLQVRGDVDRVGRFLVQAGPAAFFDLLWLPICLAGISLIHPLLGLYAGAGVALIAGIVLGAEGVLRRKTQPNSDAALALGAFARALRPMLQFGGIGLGALLVIADAISAGGLIAATLTMGRLFAVLDAALLYWRGFVAAVEGFGRLIGMIDASSGIPPRAGAPSPCASAAICEFEWRAIRS